MRLRFMTEIVSPMSITDMTQGQKEKKSIVKGH